MKHAVRLIIIAGIISLTGILTGCDSSSSDDLTGKAEFENNSSYSVTVKPTSNEKFTTFVLEPGQSTKVDREGGKIDFTYSPSSKVTFTRIDDNDITFFDTVKL